MKYIGFDLGDGESCLSVYDTNNPSIMPIECSLTGTTSFPSVVATNEEGEIFIGKHVHDDMLSVRACFKRDFRLQTADVVQSYHYFLQGVMAQLRANYPSLLSGEYQFVVGQPADWEQETLQQFTALLEKNGIQKPLLTSEPRAALVYFQSSRTFGLDSKLLSGSVLMVDFGSSTLDFAYIANGDTDHTKVFGDAHLGGGMMDEQIVLEAIYAIKDEDKKQTLLTLLQEDASRRSKWLMEARALKEAYFNAVNEEGDANLVLQKTCPVMMKGIQKITLQLSPAILYTLIMEPQPLLNGNSFYTQLQNALHKANQLTQDNPPKLILLTGGASQMPFFRTLCQETLCKKDAVLRYSDTPAYDIARGLAIAGYNEHQLLALKEALWSYLNESTMEGIIKEHLPALVNPLASIMIDIALPHVIKPTFTKWKKATDNQTVDELNQQIAENLTLYFSSTVCTDALQSTIVTWSYQVLADIQKKLDLLCLDYGFSVDFLQINKVQVVVKDATTGETITLSSVVDVLISTILGIVVAMMCGGGGMALIVATPIGLIIGGFIGIIVGLLGGKFTRELAKNTPLPRFIRKGISSSSITSPKNVQKMKKAVSAKLLEDEAFFQSLLQGITTAINQAIEQMATQEKW